MFFCVGISGIRMPKCVNFLLQKKAKIPLKNVKAQKIVFLGAENKSTVEIFYGVYLSLYIFFVTVGTKGLVEWGK